LLELLDLAARDGKIKTVICRIRPGGMGLARTQEVGRALDRLRAAGKKTAALIENAGTREFLLAARCEKRWIAPTGLLSPTGLNMEMTYLRGLLDKAAVEPDLLVAGKFKSAAETFTRTGASEAAREMTDGLLDNLYAQVVADLAEALGKTPAQVRKLIDGAPYTAARALKAGLVERVGYRDEMLKELEVKNTRLVPGGHYWRVYARRIHARAVLVGAPVVALVHLSGAIREGRGDPARGVFGASSYVKLLRRLARDKHTKAVVLRVSSPGGSATGSDLIRRELEKLAGEKPLIVSLGDVAASGGYYVAVPGKKVLVERGTLTGSIGVIAGKFDLSGLYAKFGVRIEAHRRGQAAGIFSPTGRFSKIERTRMEEVLGAMYREFKQAVAAGRKLSPERVDELAEGRVWTGTEALSAKLADDVGGVNEALRIAKLEAGGVEGEPAHIVEYPVIPGPLKMLMSLGAATRDPFPLSLPGLEIAQAIAAGPYMGLPFELKIH
jgi:protease-4